jgi:Zn-dependent M28 family amino/carboxypeptidase
MRKSVFFLTLLLCASAAVAVSPERFDDAHIRSTIQILSSDAFGGRAPGSPGEQLTIDYIAKLFKAYGLAPANQGSYFQDVPLVQITADPDTSLNVSGADAPLRFAYAQDMVVSTARPEETVSLQKSPLVFAGYGIVAPEYQWDDYAGLDVKGKTVVVLVNDPGYATGDPKLFEGKTMTYYGRWTYKYEEAARHGAAGVLIVHDLGPAGYPWEVVRGSWTGPLEELPPHGAYQPAIQGWITLDAAKHIFTAAGLDFEAEAKAAAQHGFRPVPLKLTADITLHNSVKSIVSHNVVAMVKGASHPDEALIYSAHWDHLGTKPGPDGKLQIFHGAIDNGSGIAALLELARVFAADPKPGRSVIFVATTSEEQNLLGAAYYAAHPLLPLAQTAADINMDVMNMYGLTRDVAVRGQSMSTLDELFVQQAAKLGLQDTPDAQPEKGYYFRADHFAFAKAGVPALSITTGTDYVGRSAGWGLAQQQAYTSQRYHKPADQYEPDWDLAGMRQQLELLYLTGRTLTDGNDWPAWHAGSPFRAAREAERPAGR